MGKPWWLGAVVPDLRVDAVTDISPEMLAHRGVHGVLLDLDDTLVSQLEHEPTPVVRDWMRAMGESFALYIVSNNRRVARVKAVAEGFGVKHVHLAAKPMRRGFRRALRDLGLRPEQVAVVGDQLFTDVLGGNRLGGLTILVTPISGMEHKPVRRAMRVAEAWVLDRVGPIAGPAHKGEATDG